MSRTRISWSACAMILLFFSTHSIAFQSTWAINLRPTSPIISSSNDSFEMERNNFISSLTSKVSVAANIPIFEFGQDVTNFLKKAEDSDGRVDPSIMMELELIFFNYMTRLNFYYGLRFANTQAEILSNGLPLTRSSLIEERDHSLRQCRKAMQSALPSNLAVESWSFEVLK